MARLSGSAYRINGYLRSLRRCVPSIPPTDRSEYAAAGIELLYALLWQAMQIVHMAAPPAFSVKGGPPLDPTTGQVVRNYSGVRSPLSIGLSRSASGSRRCSSRDFFYVTVR